MKIAVMGSGGVGGFYGGRLANVGCDVTFVARGAHLAALRELGVKRQPRSLLAQVPGLELKEMEEAETCCGFGGAFAVKFGEISTHIAERKCANITACGADAVVLGDLGCMLNIEGRLRRRGDLRTEVLHVAEVLAGETGK